MFPMLNPKTAIVAAAFTACSMAVSAWMNVDAGPRLSRVDAPTTIEVAAGAFRHVLPGEFTRAGRPTNAPRLAVKILKPIAIMRRQVTAAEYRRCVDDHGCAPATDASDRADLPAVMVSWRDATAYAAWLSGKLGVRYRLPTDEEWTYAAGRRAPDETGPAFDANDPSKNWIARYEREANADPVDKEPQPIGHFGINENGLLDVSGNVWEWTDTCYSRAELDLSGAPAGARTRNCGVRVVEGRHRTYVSDFIRDARGGGCAVGTPPSNLGFRLVRENERRWWLF